MAAAIFGDPDKFETVSIPGVAHAAIFDYIARGEADVSTAPLTHTMRRDALEVRAEGHYEHKRK